METPSNSPVQIGDVVAGKYRVERPIGRGGIGVVVAAHHLALDEPVALKFIGIDFATEREVVQRLLREARATFRLRSQHTVRVLDADELPSGSVYIVMELLHGHDLRTELANRGRLPETEVVTHVLQACDALEEAHTLGIVHRDLKPHNLFLARQRLGPPIVKVLDFGMSKVDPAFFEAGPLTLPETALGTPRYMAPEQWKSAATVDHRADIWALGVVMYELVTGIVPLQGMPLGERQARLLAGAVPSPREVRGDVSEAMSRIIGRCLKADPMGRWRSVAHLAAALRDAHPGLGPETDRAEVTLSAVTAVVSTKDMHERAARSSIAETSDVHGRPPDPSLASTPISFDGAGREDDPEEQTIVRAPLFQPQELVLEALPSPAVEKGRVADKASIAGTLRSAGPLSGPLMEALAAMPQADQTLRLPGAPLHPVFQPGPPGGTFRGGHASPASQGSHPGYSSPRGPMPAAPSSLGSYAPPPRPAPAPLRAPPRSGKAGRAAATILVWIVVAIAATSVGALVAWVLGGR